MEIVFYVGIVLFVIFGPWIFLWRVNSRRKSEHLEAQSRWSGITARVFTLEREVRELRNQPAGAPPSEPARQTVVAEPARATTPPIVPATPTPVPAEPVQTSTMKEEWIAAKKVEPLAEPRFILPRAEPPPPPPPIQPKAEAPPPAAPPIPEPFIPAEPQPSLVDRVKSLLDIEEMLGTNWLNKLGIALLVVGIAFFLAYELTTVKEMGKVLVGLLTSAAMLGSGIWFDRKERYRILARAGIGGGWALLFFTTYAMYFVPATHVLSSEALDLFLMLAVATAMVAHTLRYRSQVVTGLAFLLAFLTVSISHSNVYSLSAGGILAAGLVVIVGRMQWFELEVVGILASYLNHYLWLRPIIEPMQGQHKPFKEFTASAGMLLLYWLIFRVSYVFRKPVDARQEHISSAAALLNTSLLLALFKYQSTHPEWAFWALLAIGGIEAGLGQLPITRRRRSAVIVLSTLGVVLLIAAFPFRYSGTHLSVLWLAEAEALLLVGVWTKEVVFRRLGMIASLVVAGHMLCVDAATILGRRIDGGDTRSSIGLAIVFSVAAAIFYLNAHWIFRRWADLFVREFDKRVMQRSSYVGAAMLLVAAWLAFPEAWTAVAWGVLAFGLAFIGHRIQVKELGYQSNLLAAAAVVRVLVVNLDTTGKFQGVALRVITIALVAALLYLTSRWSWQSSGEHDIELAGHTFTPSEAAAGAYTWAASFLLAVLAWYELQPVHVALAWTFGGLVLFELGLWRRKISLRSQSYVAFAASILQVLTVNFAAAGVPGRISPRLYTVAPIALAFYYVYCRLRRGSNDDRSTFEQQLREILSWIASFLLAFLAWYELRPVGVADAWAIGGLILFEIGLTRKNLSLRFQAYVALVSSFLRIFFVNLNASGSPGEISPRFYSIVPVALVFFYTYRRLDENGDLWETKRTFKAADLCSWMGTITIAALMRFELEADWVAAAWAALAFALLAISWRSRKQVFLHQGLFMVLAVLFRTVLHNFYERTYFPPPPGVIQWSSRWMTVGTTVALLLAALPVTFQLRRKNESSGRKGVAGLMSAILRRPEQLVFFLAIGLLTTLLALEMRHGMVTLSWGLEGIAVFMLALSLHERSFRLTGLALVLLSIGKILIDDVWRLGPRDRYLTFIGLGAASLLMSFLYTHNKEKLRQYL